MSIDDDWMCCLDKMNDGNTNWDKKGHKWLCEIFMDVLFG